MKELLFVVKEILWGVGQILCVPIDGWLMPGRMDKALKRAGKLTERK